MIGPTGVGKTEIARRIARLVAAPFIKVEASKFTEVGYVGRDVESIVRDLVELAITSTREQQRDAVKAKAEIIAEDRLIDVLTGAEANNDTKQKFRKMLREGKLDDREVEVDLNDKSGGGLPTMDIPGMPGGQMGMINIGDMLGGLGQRKVKRKLKVNEAYEHLVEEEADNLIDQEDLTRTAIQRVENDGIVFLDEIDKIAVNSEVRGGSVSREGVQRDLLPLIEGTTVTTKYGPVKTDHVLFICSGAFHLSKPSDLLPELQGRMPIRVELNPLTRDDLKRILTEPENSLVKQYVALLGTEGVTLNFDEASIDALADLSAEINQTVENIGARRLATVMERLLEEISFAAPDRGGETIQITETKVREEVGELAKDADLSRFIL
jgi:ATP-dependent HslUV protease ATP-binding subunit HslU